MISRWFAVASAVITMLLGTGCAKNPSGIYVSRSIVFEDELIHEADFRANGTCYYKGAFDPARAHAYTWTKSGSTIEIRNGSKVVETFIWDGNDLVPAPGFGGGARRFVKK